MNFYRALLHLYPSSYRAEYGDEMSGIFAQQLRMASGPMAKFGLALAAFVEVLSNAIAVHWQIARRDLSYSLRSLLRSPAFTITAVLLITIGIGANAAIFTLADFVLVRPLPFPEPQRLVKLWEKHPGYSMMELSPPNYRDINTAAKSFAAFAAYAETMPMNLVGQGEPLRIDGSIVTGNLFSTLARSPWIGRYFVESDDQAGAPATVILSYALWQNEFGGEASVLGKTIYLNDEAYTVVGVMPPDFQFPTRETQFWRTFRFKEEDYKERDNNYLTGIARLKPGVTIAQARSEVELIARRLQQQYPKENEDVSVTVLSPRDELSKQSRLLLFALVGAAVCLLVIACANLANLLIVRAIARQKELSIRVSLGANRRTILRQLLSESLILGIAGGLGAVGVAAAALPLLARLVPTALPTKEVPPVDLRLLLLALGLTATTVIAFGVAPAVRACRNAGLSGLHEGVRTGGAGGHRARSLLVIAEVAISMVLLISSGLLIRAMWKVQATDPGFRTRNVLTLRTSLAIPKYEKTRVRGQFYTKVLSEVRRLPGVTDAAYASAMPMLWRGGIWPVEIGGRAQNRTEGTTASLRFLTSGFFATMAIPLKAGRDVSENDTADTQHVAVVSESFARRYWPDESPIGHHFGFAFHDREIVGVVGDVRVRGLERTSEPQVYLPYKQVPDGWLIGYVPKDLAIHTNREPEYLIPEVRKIIAAADPQQPISNVRTMEEIVAGETQSRAVQTRVLMTFTVIAVFLAALGIYGLLSFTVSLRSQEFGIRMALGAQQGDIFRLVLKKGTALAIAGLIPGLLLAYGAARWLESLLAGLKPGDVMTFSAATLLCFSAALLGTLVPALRAIRVDPTTVMRAE
jgi:putative ABC transport system permease protein